MDGVPFTKMSGLGNDFVIVDNRSGVLHEIPLARFARGVCARRISLGADQLMLIERAAAGGHFAMRTINVDGTEVKMCGNASRCVARYAYVHGIAPAEMLIETPGGPVHAWVARDGVQVLLQLTSPIQTDHALLLDGERQTVHTVSVSGAPHAVIELKNARLASDAEIHRLGAAVRHHPDFPDGINANFIEIQDRHVVDQRTFERGVEGETLACGTGAVASSVTAAVRGLVESPVRVRVRGGELTVAFRWRDEQFEDIVLGGDARFIADGVLHPEAWTWDGPSA